MIAPPTARGPEVPRGLVCVVDYDAPCVPDARGRYRAWATATPLRSPVLRDALDADPALRPRLTLPGAP